MSGVGPDHLNGLYAGTDDPWNFRTSGYERARFAATREALPRARYRSALEIGCGNGELARRIAPLCSAYHGIDAVARALESARLAVPDGTFTQAFLPAWLPDGAHDLIVLSEILYFLDGPGIADLADQIDRRWPRADIVCVTWRGPSGNPLQGEEAFELFRAATARAFDTALRSAAYRIDVAAGPA